jgi:moderate conductance mechanosensitive channel
MEIFGFNVEPLIKEAITILIKAAFLIITYWIVKPIGKKIIVSAMNGMSKRQKLSESRKKTLEKLIMNIFTYVLMFVFIVTFFSIIHMPIGPVLAGAGIVGLAVGFGAQGLVSDIVTGFFILLERQMDVDDYVTAAGIDGIVEEIGLRTTKIRGINGTLHFIPNRNIINVSNHSRGNRSTIVDIGIFSHEELHKIKEVLRMVCETFQNDPRIKEGPYVLSADSFGKTEIVTRMIALTESGEQKDVKQDIREALIAAFAKENIEFPSNSMNKKQ